MNWNKWIRKDRGSKLTAGILLCLSATFFFYMRLTQPVIRSKSDLKFIKARLRSHRFTDGARGYHNYIFWTLDYSNPFQISADFINIFKEMEFQQLQYGDTLVLALSKEGYNKLTQHLHGRILVYSINNPNINLLDSDKVIKKYNDPLIVSVFICMFLIGSIIIYLVYRSKLFEAITQEQNQLA